MQVNFIGRIKGEHYRRGKLVADSAEEAMAVVERFLTVSETERRTEVVVSRSDRAEGIGVVVDPKTRYATLDWSMFLHSRNPAPFADAPLIAQNYDDDPLVHWMRNSYVPLDATKESLRQYLEAGSLPTAVEWQPFGFEVYELPDWVADDPEATGHYFLIERSGVD